MQVFGGAERLNDEVPDTGDRGDVVTQRFARVLGAWYDRAPAGWHPAIQSRQVGTRLRYIAGLHGWIVAWVFGQVGALGLPW